MSGMENRGGDISPTRQPRQSRTHSVGLPPRTSLLPEPPPEADIKPPPIPRRHSAAPTVAPPPIPLRSKNERPIIPLKKFQERADAKKQQENSNQSSSSCSSAVLQPTKVSSWKTSQDNAASPSKWIDLDTSGQLKSIGTDFLVDFERNFDQHRGVPETTSFQELQKASRDLEKRLHERIIKSAESKFGDVFAGKHEKRDRKSGVYQHQRLYRERSKFQDGGGDEDAGKPTKTYHLSSSERMTNRAGGKSKFEELQAVSKNLEKRLLTDGSENHGVIDNEKLPDAGLCDRKLVAYKCEGEKIGGFPEPNRARFGDVDLEKTRYLLQNGLRKEGMNKVDKLVKATQTNLPPPLSAISSNSGPKPSNVRQDSNVSSDSFSQTSSPSYTSKTMEAPLLPHKHIYGKIPGRALVPEPENPCGSPITKSMSTPASLQAIVRFHNGSNMSLHHRIIRDMRRPSTHYVTNGKLRFRFAQILVNAVALLIIAGGLAAYFKSYPGSAVRYENKTIYTTAVVKVPEEAHAVALTKNPAPGICLPVIVSFCLYHKIPYNFTVFPNYMGNFGQRDAQHEIELYDAVVDVRCYELAALFLCSVFVPKCGSKGQLVCPCRSLCFQTKRRCGFFLQVFGLSLPDYLDCDLFPEKPDPDECVGYHEVMEAAERAEKPVCSNGFECDATRCIPLDWRCDGHVDCADQTDELDCGVCGNSTTKANKNELMKKNLMKAIQSKSKSQPQALHCGERRCMSSSHVCDGVTDCPWGQDERNCLRLSERTGDIGKGLLEVYDAEKGGFIPACITNWKNDSEQMMCSLLGYEAADSSILKMKGKSNTTAVNFRTPSFNRWTSIAGSGRNPLKEFQSCSDQKSYPILELSCSKYRCGRRNQHEANAKARKRIVGGVEAAPGDWPFLAALLGGPEQIFYCAGVLIADQWVLTASHCVGNFSHSEVSGWTIQLGITRRHAHTYLGQKMKVKRVVPHPNYDLGATHDNDVALFQLEKRVQFHEHLRPVCLPTPETELLPGTQCTVIGWGKKEDTEASEYEPAVNEVTVPVLNRELCNSWLEPKELNITDGMICAGYPEGGKDACQGDSGGPLLCQDERDKERWFVGGIVSWGIKCAHPKLPGVYAYVPKYVPWIRKEMEKFAEKDTG